MLCIYYSGSAKDGSLAWFIKRKSKEGVVSHVSRGIFQVLTRLTANVLGVARKRHPCKVLCAIYCILLLNTHYSLMSLTTGGV